MDQPMTVDKDRDSSAAPEEGHTQHPPAWKGLRIQARGDAEQVKKAQVAAVIEGTADEQTRRAICRELEDVTSDASLAFAELLAESSLSPARKDKQGGQTDPSTRREKRQ